MYQHGKPIYKISHRPLIIILAALLLIIGTAFYLIVLRGNSKTTLNNNDKPLVSTVKASNKNTDIEQADFGFSLPGKWQLSAKDWDARYRSWQWKFLDKHFAGRLFMVYEDTIPADYAVNYMLPVSANGDGIETGQISGNCADFTTTAQTKINTNGTVAAVSKWQGIDFLCDYGRQSLQVVGTSSLDGVNTLKLTGETDGTHKYFFLYQDNDISPDLGVMGNILSTFQAK